MTNVTLCRAAYARYVNLGIQAIAAADIFPKPIVEIIQQCIGQTKSEFYRQILVSDGVVGVSMPPHPKPDWWKPEYLVAVRIDDTLLRSAVQKFHEGDLHHANMQASLEKHPIDKIFESEAAMYSKIMAWIYTQPEFTDLQIERKYEVSVLIRESTYKSFADKADQYIASII